MSENSTHKTTMADLHNRFLQLLKQLLERENFHSVELEAQLGANRADFVTISPQGSRTIGELKLYRTANAPIMSATFAIRKLQTQLTKFQGKNGLLVMTSNFPAYYINSIDFEGSLIKIWDLEKLKEKFGKYPDLTETFITIMNDLQPFQEEAPDLPNANTNKPPETLKNTNIKLPEVGHLESFGTQIATRLKKIPAGRESAQAYESTCIEALKYLFKTDLAAWKEQPTTDEGLHRFDLIARVTSDHEFWLTLQNHFRAKYIVFEFKNLEDKITQREIYSTEKYLYLPAMRPVAIIISREGGSKNALAAARGALREHGKIIINLSTNEICEMLIKKDEGSVPSDQMTTILDDMLMHIER